MGELYGHFGCKLHEDEGLIKNLFKFKSIKFFIMYVETEHSSVKASRTPVNYIILFRLVVYIYCNLHCIYFTVVVYIATCTIIYTYILISVT